MAQHVLVDNDVIVPALRVTPLEEELFERISEVDARLMKDECITTNDYLLILGALRKVAPFFNEDKLRTLATLLHVGTVPAYRDDVLEKIREATSNVPQMSRFLANIIDCAAYSMSTYRTLPEASDQEWQEWMDTF